MRRGRKGSPLDGACGECARELEIGSETARKCQRLRLAEGQRKKAWPTCHPASGRSRPALPRSSSRHAFDAGWFFPSPRGTRWDPDNFAADLRKANREAELKWTCLDNRHTFGSQLAQRGVSLYKIATLLGNSPEICRRHYAALIPEAMGAEVEFDAAGPVRIAT